MQKVYLLRHDRKTGPFTLTELLQQPLHPTDLLWIEGQSTGWTTLADLELTPSSVADATPTPETADTLEDKAEALRRRALDVPPRVFTRTPDTLYNYHEEEEPGEDAILLIDHRKQRHNMVSEVLMTVFIVALLAGGLLGGRRLFRGQSATATMPVVTRMSTTDEHAAARVIPASSTMTTPPAADTQLMTAPAPTAMAMAPVRRTVVTDTATQVAAPKTKAVEDTQIAVKEEAPKQAPPARTEEKKEKEVKEAKPEKTAAAAPKPDEETAEPQKHKGLGQALKNLFRKKKKTEDAATDN